MLCQMCDRLNVEDLVELKRTNSSNRKYFGQPGYIYWEHYSTFIDLEAAAKYCELCDLVVRRAKNMDQHRQRGNSFLKHSENIDLVVLIAAEQYSAPRVSVSNLWQELHQPVFDTQVFDTLVFAHKPRRSILSGLRDHRSFGIHNIPMVVFYLKTPRGDAKHINGNQIGHFPFVDELSSEENYGIGREWIQSCIDTHTDCGSNKDNILPTRLVDIGSEGNDPRLVQTAGLKGKYLALSHCWGGSISNCLTLATIQAFQKKIPLSELPVNFRDAVLITRGLGFRYLWIDSLCIMQDSKCDWDTESENMGNIFRNAFLTIAAARAINANDGILNARSLPKPSDTQGIKLDPLHDKIIDRAKARLKIWRDRELDDTVDTVAAGGFETLEDIHRTGALNRRGWTLQEQVFSPRILYFGHRQIYWRCLHGYLAADGIPVHIDAIEGYTRLLRSFHVHSRPSKFNLEDVMAGYHNLVMAYSKRHLTYASDKLPAFGGIAAFVHSLMGGHYLAGIMSSCFREGLLWHSRPPANIDISHLYRAPSWSWAVVDDWLYLRKRLLPLTVNDAKLVGHHIVHTGENPYGSVQAGHILIEGMTHTLCQKHGQPRASTGYVTCENPYRTLILQLAECNGSSCMAIFPEYWKEPRSRIEVEMKFLFVAIDGCGTPCSAPRSDFLTSPTQHALGLCLIRNQNWDVDGKADVDGNVDTEITYRRVGYVQIEIEGAEQWAATMSSKAWKRETLKLV